MIPYPFSSYLGLPALPSICITSCRLNYTHLPYYAEYTWVPLIITVCAGKLTPQAKVAVEIKILKCLSANNC